MTHVLALSSVLPLMSGQPVDLHALMRRLVNFIAAGLRAPVAVNTDEEGTLMRALPMFLLAASLCWAQSPLPLSMKRAVEIALAPDGSTRAALAQESIQQAKDRVAEARAALLPNLDTTVRENRQTTNLKAFGFAFNIPVPGFSIPTIVGPFDVFDARASAQQSLLNFSSRPQISGIQGHASRHQIR